MKNNTRCILMIALILLLMPLFALAADKASKITDMQCVGGDHSIRFSFTAPGHDRVYIQYSTSQEKGNFLLFPEDGVYSGEIALPLTYAGSNVYITVQAMNKKTLLQKYNCKTGIITPQPIQKQEGRLSGMVICLDPGHQANAVPGKEPVGPGLRGEKANKGGMAQGTVTRRLESVVNLEICFVLRDVLLSQGADVVMTRDHEDTHLSNIDRDNIAEEGGAHIMLRVHCNAAESATAHGISVIMPLHSDYAKQACEGHSYAAWGKMMLQSMMEKTGVTKGGSRQTDEFIGNNWAKMPCFLLECGYMTNFEEDLLLSDPAYQLLLCEGIADGCYAIGQDLGLVE